MGFQQVYHLNNPFHLHFTGGITPTGEYNEFTTYKLGDSVSYGLGSYVAMQETTGNLPTDTMYWQQLVAPGAGDSLWEEDEEETIKPKNNKLINYNKLKNTPDLTQYQKMVFDDVLGNFITS